MLNRAWGTVTIACKYPEVAVRWMDMFYDDEVNFQNCYGYYDVEVDADGTIRTPAPPSGVDSTAWVRRDCFMGDALRFTLEKWSSKVAVDPKSNAGLRNAFMDKLLPYRTNYIPSTLLFPEEDTVRMNELETEIQNLIRNKYATWIIEGGVDAEWDAYKAELKKLRIDEYVGIHQRSYDHWAGK
jgi:putative aldouronate transport system substrate-binding protein